MRAAIYLRVSLDNTGEELAVTRQREDCQRIVSERGWTMVGEFVDNSISASDRLKKRPGYERLVAAYGRGEFDALVCWDLDRLTRQPRQLEDWIDAAEEHGLRLVTANGEADLGTDGGRMFARVKAAVARAEVERKAARQKRAALQAAQQGRCAGGRRPFGYAADGMAILEREADAIRDGYRALLAGDSLGAIARDWNARGLTTSQIGHRSGHAGLWRRDNVRAVLLNPRNAGKRAHRGEIVGDAKWPAIIDEATFAAVTALLADPSRRRPPGNARNLLSGLALCGVCGATVHGGGGVRRGVRAYRCSAALGHVGRAAEPVEDYVSRVIVARLSRPDAAELLVDRNRPDLDALRNEAMALHSRLDTAAGEYADGAITAAQLRTITERLRTRIADVESQMADAGRVDVLGPLVHAADVQAVWDSLGTARQRAVIDVLAVVRVHPPGRGVRTFRPETVEIAWRTP